MQDQANIGSHTFEKSIAFADFDYELFTLPKFNSWLAPEKLVTNCPAPIGKDRGCFKFSCRKPAKCHHRLLVPVPGPPSSLNLESLQIRTAGDFQEIFDRFWASHYGPGKIMADKNKIQYVPQPPSEVKILAFVS